MKLRERGEGKGSWDHFGSDGAVGDAGEGLVVVIQSTASGGKGDGVDDDLLNQGRWSSNSSV